MKIKRFQNVWTMGLILCGAMLLLFYIAKLFFTQWIIGVAELPRIVSFGNFVQSNKWYLHIFNALLGYVHAYILYSACTRKPFLSWKGNVVLISQLILLRFISEFYPTQYNSLNVAFMMLAPFFICVWEKDLNKDTFVSCTSCFGLEIGFEFLSLAVRNLMAMTNMINVATVSIMVIDVFIWRIILYLFFNYKNDQINERGYT